MPSPNQNSKAEALAPWVYQCEDFFRLEQQLLFRRHWLLAGHINDLRQSGDYLTLDAAGERALVVRDAAGNLNGFHNVCRHRGARLLADSNGNCRHLISCPFHGWSYSHDGKLQNISLPKTFPSIDRDDYGLVPLALEVWHGFVFVNFSENPAPLAQQLAPIENEVAPYQLEHMLPLGERYDENRPYNWKIIHDIDNEGYHVPFGHPSLQQLYGQSYEDRIENGIPVSDAWISDKPAKLWSVRHYQKLLPNFDHLPKNRQRCWWYIGVFPNLVFGFYPDMVEYYMTLPVSPTETRYIGGAYGLADNRREVKAARFLNLRINNITEQEDESFVSDMQQGMSSSVFPTPTYSTAEQGVAYFHSRIQQHIPVATLRDKPTTLSIAAQNEKLLATRAAEES